MCLEIHYNKPMLKMDGEINYQLFVYKVINLIIDKSTFFLNKDNFFFLANSQGIKDVFIYILLDEVGWIRLHYTN